jgi:cytochrome c553
VIDQKIGRATLSGHGSQRAQRGLIAILAAGICFTVGAMVASAQATDRAAEAAVTVPAWVFPVNPPSPADPPALDRVKPLRLPHSNVTYTEAQLNDLFTAPDWHPMSHSAMPEVVARGRAPDVYACGFCHTPGGQGRPENASLAGLPAPYIVQQLADFRSGARRSAWRGPYRPPELMIQAASYATVDEVAAAAAYFSQQAPTSHVIVVERARVPRSRVVGWVYAAITGAGDEPLGQRLLEFAPDITRHELRDDDMRYIAYVPLGSIRRGRSIATTGTHGPSLACISCHGDKLQGIGLVPRLAGRSPSYLLRQLLAFQTGARAGTTGLAMLPVVATLEIGNMIDVAAYAASLQP